MMTDTIFQVIVNTWDERYERLYYGKDPAVGYFHLAIECDNVDSAYLISATTGELFLSYCEGELVAHQPEFS